MKFHELQSRAEIWLGVGKARKSCFQASIISHGEDYRADVGRARAGLIRASGPRALGRGIEESTAKKLRRREFFFSFAVALSLPPSPFYELSLRGVPLKLHADARQRAYRYLTAAQRAANPGITA